MRLRTWLTFMPVRSCSCCVLSPIFDEAVLDVLLAQLGAYSPCTGDWLLVHVTDAFDFWVHACARPVQNNLELVESRAEMSIALGLFMLICLAGCVVDGEGACGSYG